jgi:transcription elongation factor GreA
MSQEVPHSQPTVLTQEGLVQLETELQYLRSTKRREVALRIKRAAELGDRSENSEYEDAKNEQAFVEGRIRELDRLLRNVKVIDAPAEDRPRVVALGCTVEILDTATGERFTYTIVGPVEVDLGQGRISHLSPVGAALMGRAPGDRVRVQAPDGTRHLQVSRIR